MPIPPQEHLQNGLLRTMPPASFERLRPHLEKVALPLKARVTQPNEPTPFVHFIETGLVSMLTSSEDEADQIEVGHIGWEGMTNFHVAHGVDRTPHRAFVQAETIAWQLPSASLMDAWNKDRELRVVLGRYIHSYMVQVSQTALANGRYNMHQRLARWVLMCHDRMRSDQMRVTHEFLSLMLGVRRSGVTNEIQILEGMQIVRARRGLVNLRDRPRLKEVAAGSYGVAETEYERCFGISLSYRDRA